MSEYSKSHEREERGKMGRGLWYSIFGLFFCWFPGVGLFLSISGFIRQMVRLTAKYRARLTLYLTISVISMVACIGVLIGEIFLYSRDPNILNEVGHVVWEALTGQTEYAWELSDPSSGDGFDYSGYTQPGLGVMDGQQFADPTQEPVLEDDVYYGDEGEEFDPNAENDDQDLEGDELTDDTTFDEEEYLPSVKDVIDEMKDPEGLLQSAF